jgi:hypothetical protein
MVMTHVGRDAPVTVGQTTPGDDPTGADGRSIIHYADDTAQPDPRRSHDVKLGYNVRQ